MTSASLPLPPSLLLSLSHILPLPLSASLSLYRALCVFFLLPPLPFLSIPPLRDGVCRCCSGVWGLTRRGEDPLPFPRFAAFCSGVSSRRVLHHLCCLSAVPPPHLLPVRVSGSQALGGGGNQHRASLGSSAQLAMPCPGIF